MGRGGSASSTPEKGTAAVMFFISTRPILVNIGLLTTAQRTNGADGISQTNTTFGLNRAA